MLHTPLFEEHKRLGAKLVDFGGWEMPLHYGSQIEEHHAVRRAAGMFDVSHMRVVDLSGEHCFAFLQKALANNVAKLKTTGRALYSCMLNEHGGVIDDLIVYFIDAQHYRLVVNAGTAEKDIAWLRQLNVQMGSGLSINPRNDLAMVAVQGPAARSLVWKVRPEFENATREMKPFHGVAIGDCFVARTGYTGEDGFEIIVPAEKVATLWRDLDGAGVKPCGLGARDTLRLEAGMNLYGQDMNDETSPLESGLAWTVDRAGDRDFVGKQAMLARPVTHTLLGLVPNGPGLLRSHQKVKTPHGEGEITSGSFSPTLNKAIAFARIPARTVPGDTVQVEVRGKWLDCTVFKLPFVRNGQPLI